MADKLQGTWIFDENLIVLQPFKDMYRDVFWRVDFKSEGKEFKYIRIGAREYHSEQGEVYNLPYTYILGFTDENSIDSPMTPIIYDGKYFDLNKGKYRTIEITSKYDEVENAEELLQALQARANFIDTEGNITLFISSQKGIKLKTKDKSCSGDISVIPLLKDEVSKYFEERYETVDLPYITKIKQYAFYKDAVLKNINMPQVTSIEQYAFSGCTKLALTELPNGLTSIGQYAFNGCAKLALTELPNGVTSIGTNAFYSCTNLALTSLSSGLTSISNYAFYGCTNLALTELPSGLTSIGGYTFQNCPNLALTSLPNGLTSIGSYAFYGCTNLALTELPSGLTSIGGYTFYDCQKLALTELPSGLTSISNYAFYNCKNIKGITFKGRPTTITSNAFKDCTNITTINVPWAEGAVSGAPWGATNATINYNYTGE